MSVQARWHLADLPGADDDPMSDLLNLGKPIDLSQDRARLNAELSSLIKAEGMLSERTGVECELKFQPGANCFNCSQYAAGPHQGAHYEVCRIGRAQFSILGQLRAHDELEELEELAMQHLVAEECEELAVAVLPEELVEAA